jgi:DNA-directed RNA polymerase specialized sigma24 family protein
MDTAKQLEQVRQDELKARRVLLELAAKRRELIRRLRQDGFTFQKIADIYGVTRQRAEQMSK